MNLASKAPSANFDDDLVRSVDAACARIAPTWPIDQFIAVNPLWGHIEEPVMTAADRVASLTGSRPMMARAWFAEQWRSGRLRESDLRLAIEQTAIDTSVEELVAHLQTEESETGRRELLTDVADRFRDTVHGMPWCEFVTHTISQLCAGYFDEGQAQLGPDRSRGLYSCWRDLASHDLSPRLLMGLRDYRSLLEALPDDPWTLIAKAISDLGVADAQREAYLTALLKRVNGWAAWCSYRRWTARLDGRDDDQIVHLLAVRLAWEWILFRSSNRLEIASKWKVAMANWPSVDRAVAESHRLDWVLQRGMELAYQIPLASALAGATAASKEAGAAPEPLVQIAFCIDVRSEVFRRAIEAVAPQVQTLGFAGFFGVPIAYQPLAGQASRPQLPGLLAPSLRVSDQGAPAELAERRASRLAIRQAWKRFRRASVSGFGFVESMGLFSAADLVGQSLRRARPNPNPDDAGLSIREQDLLKPRLEGLLSGGELTRSARADLAAGILRAMSLTTKLARLVVLAGHGAESANNPYLAGLHCGACCGQTGEVNARVVAALLNDADVRADLAVRGIEISPTTRFLAALHNTTCDRFDFFDLDELPASHAGDFEALAGWLDRAGERARSERAPDLGLSGLGREALDAAITRRARDWSEVRPEWGLANNAAFIVAPRERSRALDLGGRSFLHDYRWDQDEGFGILELIMTAPMVVTHWINFQYYASTVDNRLYGSGNKVLHNVVGARLGVFEGNGGDLRIGLALQSLHDGRRWVHDPLRLSVFIEAPRDAMDRVLEKHESVRRLVENEWLFLFQIDEHAGAVFARRKNAWERVETNPS
jgi:uncharacterized protein YbcC (UPF0753/DUF2309 family)